LLRSLEASSRRRSFAKATSPAQRILHFCRHLSPSRFPAIRGRLPGPKGLWRIGSARRLPLTSILLVEKATAASATALPRLGTRANPMSHTPDTRRQAAGGSDARPKALADFPRAVGAPAALDRHGGVWPLKRSSGTGPRALSSSFYYYVSKLFRFPIFQRRSGRD
jgi:hypothetical protein